MAVHDYDKTLTRLITILSKLNDGEALTTKEFAAEFNVVDRTILRDMERLSSFHVYKDKKKWRMQEAFKLQKSKSFEDELILDIFEKFSDGIGGKFASKAHRLLKKLKNEDNNPIYTKLNIEDISDKLDEIKTIEEAIRDRKVISCIYDNEREPAKREILKPLKIVNYEGFWYLVALDEDEYVKKRYLKKISVVKILEAIFSCDTKIEEMLENSISVWFQSDREPFDVKIYAEVKAAKYFKRRPLPTQKIESIHLDGSIEFCVTITYEMEIIPIIKYWLPYLKVLEPTWIQDIIEDELKEYLEK